MASVFGHIVASTAIGLAFFPKQASPKILATAALCAAAPDLDIFAFNFGIPYLHPFGHRGASHSILFAVALGLGVAWLFFRRDKAFWKLTALFFLATLSHPMLDACTTGGRGVALFFPFDNARIFFPWRVIKVSPISIGDFFDEWGLKVLASEARWILLPSLALVAASWVFQNVTQRRRDAKP